MSQETILQTIPHRPPFLFLDEMVEVTETGATARREIRAEEPQFEGHYPGNPIMPGVLLSEACFQCAAVYLGKKLEAEGDGSAQGTPVLARITQAKFKNMVRPGDVITISVTFQETMGMFHMLRGKIVNQDNKVCLTIDFALALISE